MRAVAVVAPLCLAAALMGCADTEATTEELALARQEARQVGREEARGKARHRIRQAHARGLNAGWREGWDDAIEMVEEEEREAGVSDHGGLDPTPEKLDGAESYEFEPDDVERAGEAPLEVQEYCEGAVSEAQELGCLSHVEPWEVP